LSISLALLTSPPLELDLLLVIEFFFLHPYISHEKLFHRHYLPFRCL
jgi:hypothetical protein